MKPSASTEEIIGVIQQCTNVVLGEDAATITADAELGPDGVGIDSLDLVEIVMEIEEVLSISFETDELNGIQSIAALVDAIKAKLESAVSG